EATQVSGSNSSTRFAASLGSPLAPPRIESSFRRGKSGASSPRHGRRPDSLRPLVRPAVRLTRMARGATLHDAARVDLRAQIESIDNDGRALLGRHGASPRTI